MIKSPIGRILIVALIALVVSGCGGSGNHESPSPPEASWIRQADNPLLVPELNISTLDFGPADPTILFDGEDNTWKAWFSSTLKSTSTGVETMTIKYSESPDGVDWSDPQVVLQVAADASAWDHTHTETPSVIKNPDPSAPAGQQYIMWYAGANTALSASENRPTVFPYYQIGLAYSADGRSFTRHLPGIDNKPGLVLVAEADLFGTHLPGVFGDGLIADPEVIHRHGVFHMWFSSYAESVPDPVAPVGRLPLAFGIAHATSADGINWDTAHDNPLPSLAKSGEVAAGQQPSVLFNTISSRYEMWFSNDSAEEQATIPCSAFSVLGFWYAESSDGVNWTPDYSRRDLTYDPRRAYESLGFLTGVDVVMDNGVYHAYYTSWGTDQIPDTNFYLCPDQNGTLIPAVITLNRATFELP
ncbi:MAG: hypothetical protein HKM93_17140 [Desulfobacteraceae bacterium]|nr:hypothetical protein [Desulfobacteraceae bacterium]